MVCSLCSSASNNDLFSGSVEHIDLKLAAQLNIKIGYTPDVLTDAGKFLSYPYKLHP